MPNGTISQIDPSRLLIWKNGRPAELWLSNRDLVARLIKKHKLKALAVEEYPYLPMATELGAASLPAEENLRSKSVKIRWPIPFPGGMRIPHIHYGSKIYLVEQKQWNEFSKAVVDDLQKRLVGAKEIGFDQMLQLGEAAAILTR